MMRTALRWLAVVAVVLGAMFAWRQWTRPPIDKVGALLWEMTEIHTGFRDSMHQRGMTEEQRQSNARNAARQLSRHRDRLAALLPQLDGDTERVVRLQRFVAAWPDENAFRADLLDSGPAGSRCGPEITGLAMLVPDSRRGWMTPFRIFRP